MHRPLSLSQQRLDQRGDLPPETDPVRGAKIRERRTELVLNVHALDDNVQQQLQPTNLGRETELGRERGDQICERAGKIRAMQID